MLCEWIAADLEEFVDKVITLCIVLLWCVMCCLIVDVALYTEFYDFVQYNIPVGV